MIIGKTLGADICPPLVVYPRSVSSRSEAHSLLLLCNGLKVLNDPKDIRLTLDDPLPRQLTTLTPDNNQLKIDDCGVILRRVAAG